MTQTMQWLSALLGLWRTGVGAPRPERGSSTLETVIIAAVLSGAAIAAVALIVAAINGHAGQIK